MDAPKPGNSSHHGAQTKQASRNETPEPLLDVFKAAALSVTKLYKTSAIVEAKARSDGYQECLDDLLAFLDKQNLGLEDGQGWTVRRWATERLDNADNQVQSTDSEEEPTTERNSIPETTRASDDIQPEPAHVFSPPRTASVPPNTAAEPPAQISAPSRPSFVVPTSEAFTFQSNHQYPDIATLDLSDSRNVEGSSQAGGKSTRSRAPARPRPRPSATLGRGAGAKRRVNFEDFFDGFLGGKDIFGGGGKRSRHS